MPFSAQQFVVPAKAQGAQLQLSAGSAPLPLKEAKFVFCGSSELRIKQIIGTSNSTPNISFNNTDPFTATVLSCENEIRSVSSDFIVIVDNLSGQDQALTAAVVFA